MKILLIALTLFSFASHAEVKFAVGGGFMINRPDYKTDSSVSGSGISTHEKSTASFNIGARALVPLMDKLSFRTGAYFQEKTAKFEFESSGVSADAELKVLEVGLPLNLQYQIHDMVSAYGGYVMDLPINKYCDAGGVISSCDLTEAPKVVHNLNIGGSVHVSEKVDLELSYQHPMKAVFNDVKIYSWLFQGFYKF